MTSRLSRRGFLGAPALAAAAPRRPNIVFIIADDLRHDALSATGHPFARTPNIDRIAREGALFENFFCTTPLCSPSRASFLTGRYAHHHRIINNDKIGHDFVSHTLVTWPRLLREAGYETAFIGKWHMGPDDSRRPGFDHWISFRGQGLFIDPVVNENGVSRQLTGYMTDYLNQEAVRFLTRKRSRPFVLYLSHKAVHFPYLPARRHENLYAGRKPVYPSESPGDLEGKPALTRRVPEVDRLRLEGAVPEPAEPRRGRGRERDAVALDQLRCLASVDEGAGMILDALRRLGALDDTVVIFTSDNGYLLGEHGQFDQKRWAYEESIRIPFLLRYPRLVKAGTRVPGMTLNIDVAPAMLGFAGVDWPEPFDGRDFRPLLEGTSAPWREDFLAEYFAEKAGLRTPDWQAVRTASWKYIHYPGLNGMDELYHLASDPRELSNRIADPSAADHLAALRRRLRTLARSR